MEADVQTPSDAWARHSLCRVRRARLTGTTAHAPHSPHGWSRMGIQMLQCGELILV
jgi:hypothetical protein